MYDLIGIGIGPFNLGMAALIEDIPEIKAVFFDKREEFVWHPGMLIEGSDLQVPFLADLVTFCNPRSKYTFLNYLHTHNRLYPFFFFNRFDIPRREYSEYAAWAASEIESCTFSSCVTHVEYKKDHYEVHVEHNGKAAVYRTKHVSLGTGSIPLIPIEIDTGDCVIHSSDYLNKQENIKQKNAITVVGSGQSAAEIFLDLLQSAERFNYELSWFTRSPGFMQLESAKLGQEVFSPDFVQYFQQLTFEQRSKALPELEQLRNGIDKKTLVSIYDLLYHRSIHGKDARVKIMPLTEVKDMKEDETSFTLTCHQWQKNEFFEHKTEAVIFATGYKPNLPDWIEEMRDDIVWEDEKRYKVKADFSLAFKDQRKQNIFVLTNLEHSHGTGATNLGLSVYRNQQIINSILNREYYKDQGKTVFQQFTP
ncbi:lysine N(6)-hydroxylase/L-ornithine N(5)-oxygenase family protein [Metabacillus idriensis]|uniref:lysine N(6)-hydroxylase/L-ornithine N(5)-oxygenase family protein n=1 Tax=Metabacillus idriensis TaxID=324768 RepID=UPI003D26A079